MSFYKLIRKYRFRIGLILISALTILAHLLLRNNYQLMSNVTEKVIVPIHRWLAELNSGFSFSVGEMLIAATVILVAAFLLVRIVRLVRDKKILSFVLSILVTFAAMGLTIYALFCLLWGTYYYGTDFISQSGFSDEAISVDELADVTEYFSKLCNLYSVQVSRNQDGICDFSSTAVLEKSDKIYENIEEKYPFLCGPDVKVKGIIHSKIMSYTDFTGFFFPFTAEANVNIDSPVSDLPATVAHELAHQRGVSREQDANFVAVIACLESEDSEYSYSGAKLAFTHLFNALYSADYDRAVAIYKELNEYVRADMINENNYWKQFSSPVKEVSNTVYQNFLYSYDQDLGLKSYGACVDLLVNYYYPISSS